MVEDLVLDEDHVYRMNGVVVPGVTRVCNILHDFSGIPKDVLANAGEIGELVHDATELEARGELDEESIDPAIEGYVKAWKKFREAVRPEILSCEEKVYHRVYRYAGKLDHRMIINGEEGVLDKKTSEPSLIDAVQVSAYFHAKYGEEATERVRRMKLWALYLRENGTYKLQRYEDHMHVFLAALTVYRFKHGG